MKTNRFDEILRRKLESIQPDFQDQDWDKWQAFRQHATPTSWQTYGHWLGYAVATLTTAVMVVLYVNQSHQNKALLNEMQLLKQQVVARNQATEEALTTASPNSASSTGILLRGSKVPPADTVYVLERQTVYVDRPLRTESGDNPESLSAIDGTESERSPEVSEQTPIISNRQEPTPSLNAPVLRPEAKIPPINLATMEGQYEGDSKTPAVHQESSGNPQSETLKNSTNEMAPQGTLPGSETKIQDQVAQSYDSKRLDLGQIVALPTQSYPIPATNAYRRLQSRMPRFVKSRAPEQHVVAAENAPRLTQKSKVPASVQKVEKVAQDERLLPDFGLGLPFRMGIGQQWTSRTKSLGIWHEVLLGKHWSVQAGLSFQQLEDQKFYNDRIFREKTQEDFRKKHAKPLPQNFDIFNITVRTTLTQIPLNLTYRSDLGHNLALFAGVGTKINLRARQTLSFDFKRPTNDFGQQTAKRVVSFPLINTMNGLLGAEKRWSPIVLQASTFLTTKLQASPSFTKRSDVGVQVKVLYELGSAKK
jgi:hypothetical protein